MRVNILKPNYDASNGGLSAQYDDAIVISVDGKLTNAHSFGPNAVRVVRWGNGWIAVPDICIIHGEVGHPDDLIGPMSGGAYIAVTGSPDDAWRERIPYGFAVALHDRYETAAEYAVLSN